VTLVTYASRLILPPILIPIDNAPDIARAIQLAVAPVFLLTGIAALLGVMANRLSRIIDRWRFYEQNWLQLDSQARQLAQVEVENLERRRNFASVALYACTLAALLICVVIATLFVEVLLGSHIRGLVSALFIFAMVALISGLSTFLREVHLATRTMRISLRIHGVE